MRRMFESATLKLTGWYLLILLVISLVFSVIIFEISTSEISSRLESLQVRIEGSSKTLTLSGPLTLNDLRINQTEEAKASIFFGLVYMNLAVLGLGGIGSYLLARRTLRPIEAAHDAQSRFTSDASHELRTPLAVMKSEIQVALRDKKITHGELKKLLQSNLEEVDNLTALSQALLQLSQLDYSDISYSNRIDIVKVIQSAIKSLKAPTKRISVAIPERPAFVQGNTAMIADAVRILLDNAVKYSPASSIIQIGIYSDGRMCDIVISNEGPGIQPSDLPHIFDRFYRSDRSRSAKSSAKGYGLGLSLAKKIVKLHDGTLQAASIPGKTTAFTLSLPHVQKNR